MAISPGLSRVLTALCGIVGVAMLGAYFAAPIPQPPTNASAAQVADVAMRYRDSVMLGGWLQACGTTLSVVFFLSLVHRSGAVTKLAGVLTTLASAVLLAVGLFEASLLIDVATAAANGHAATALSSYDLMGVFVHTFPIVPAPFTFLSLGWVLLGSPVLPRLFGYLALAIGVAFEVVGFAGLFSSAALIATIVVIAAFELWILAAAIVLLVRGERAASAVGSAA